MFFCTLIKSHKLQETHLKFSPQKLSFAKKKENKTKFISCTLTQDGLSIRVHELIERGGEEEEKTSKVS